jgi:sigma-B regulation protein RsbU (phosphoserine phosphatase)
MSSRLPVDERLLEESAEDLYEHAPCGYLSTDSGGLIVKVNATFLEWTGHNRDELVGARRFQDLLTAAGRIYYETHCAPLLQMQGSIREIAVEIVRADGSLLPALVNSVTRTDDEGRPQVIRTTVFDATDRRGYERELLDARRRQSEIADELQRSLLSGSLPDHPGLEIGVEYRAGGVGLEVGGDWYDAFWIASGRTAGLVIGDVVGRGIGAAAKMGQLRSAVRALAGTGLGPGRLLDAAEQFVRRHDVGMNTTVVHAEVDLDSSTLRWACAGHPPPLLVKRDNEPVFLWEGRSPPLDAQLGEAPPRPIGTLQLDPGDLIVLYTDGLIERRGATIDEGLERLMQQTSLHRDEPADLLARSVFAALYDPQHSDDGCLLACRVNGHVGRR